MAVFDNMNASYSAGLAPEVTKYFDRTLLEVARAKLVHTKDLQKRTLPKNNGKTVQFRKFTPFKPVTEPLKEGVTPAGQTLTVTEIHATIKPYGQHVELTDETNLTTIDNITKETARLLAQQAEESIEVIAADALNTGLNVIYADASGGVNTSRSDIAATTDLLTETHIKRAVRALEKAHARRFPDGYYHAIISPDTKYDLTACTMWVDIAKYQNGEKFEKYELGKMHGVKFFESTMAKTFEATQYLYVDADVGVSDLALNGGAWDVDDKKGYFTLAKTTAYASGTDADYSHWCRRMVGQMVRIFSTSATAYYDALIDQAYVDGSNLKCTLRYMDTTADWAYASGDKVYSQSGGASDITVHSTLVYGEDYAGCVELGGNGMNIHTIIKPLGHGEDPLNQRQTIGWKVEGFCVTPLQDAYCVRIEHAVSA